MASIKVAVRVRPVNDRERHEESDPVVEIKSKTVIVTDYRVPVGKNYDHRQRIHRFNFDYCYQSVDPNLSQSINQQIYDELGKDILRETTRGYNCCLFAYGQSGSGKTFSMMGNAKDPGLIPLLCQGMFEAKTEASSLTFIMDISYVEIYNEKVYDLFSRREEKNGLRIREHPVHGPYVDGLSHHVVQDVSSARRLMEQVAENRNTLVAEETRKSKYHTIFTIRCRQILTDDDNVREVNSKLHLVDLAASERADLRFDHTRLKEGCNINKSLTTLGIVIASLSGRERRFAPYRDSVLTWLLKDSIGGNSFTFMLATISPSISSCSETISTLRYAKRVKRIINRPVINEAPTKRLLTQLKCEVNHLKEVLIKTDSQEGKMDLDDRLCASSGDSIVECHPNLEVEAHLTVTKRSNLSMDGTTPDRSQASDDVNSLLPPTFTGTLTSNYMVMLRDKISKQKQGNYIYRRLPFKVSSVDLNGMKRRRRHSDTDLSPSNLSQNFAIFRAAFSRKYRMGSSSCCKVVQLRKQDASVIDLSVDSLKSCGKNNSTKTLTENANNCLPSEVNYSEDSLKYIVENQCAGEAVTGHNSPTSNLGYSLDSLTQCPENEDVVEEVPAEASGMSPSTSTDSITFVFLSKESAQADSTSDTTDQNMSPRTLSVDSLFAEELFNQFRYQPSSSKTANTELNSCNGFQDISTQTMRKSKYQLSPVKEVPNESDKPKSEVSTAQLVQLMSDVVGLLKSAPTSCKCKQTYAKSYLRHLVEFRKQMVDATINKRPKYRVVSRNIYSCFSSESSMSGGFSSSSYLGTRTTEKCHRNPASHSEKRCGNIKTKLFSNICNGKFYRWRSDSGAVCSGSDSSDAVQSNSDKSDTPLENNTCLPIRFNDIIGDSINRDNLGAVKIHHFGETAKGKLLNFNYKNHDEKYFEGDLFPNDDYLCLPRLLKSTNVKDA